MNADWTERFILVVLKMMEDRGILAAKRREKSAKIRESKNRKPLCN